MFREAGRAILYGEEEYETRTEGVFFFIVLWDCFLDCGSYALKIMQ